MDSTYYPFPFKNPVDLRWLKVFDSLYSGDPRPGDVPEMNFWRTLEIYSEHQARRYEQAGVRWNVLTLPASCRARRAPSIAAQCRSGRDHSSSCWLAGTGLIPRTETWSCSATKM